MEHTIFVYGTLRKGERNHYLIRKAVCISSSAYTYGKLYDTGFGYPAMIIDNYELVYGEVYKVNADMMEMVYRLEGYRPGRKQNLYEVVETEVYTEAGICKATLFVAGEQVNLLKEHINSGDWVTFRRG